MKFYIIPNRYLVFDTNKNLREFVNLIQTKFIIPQTKNYDLFFKSHYGKYNGQINWAGEFDLTLKANYSNLDYLTISGKFEKDKGDINKIKIRAFIPRETRLVYFLIFVGGAILSFGIYFIGYITGNVTFKAAVIYFGLIYFAFLILMLCFYNLELTNFTKKLKSCLKMDSIIG